MLLDNNTEKVVNLFNMADDLNGIDKVRLAIHIIEENVFQLIMIKILLNY